MMGRACRPTKDTNSRCLLMLQHTRKEFYKKFLAEALPIESQLPGALHDHFNAEIVAKTIENKQEAVDWCTWTWVSFPFRIRDQLCITVYRARTDRDVLIFAQFYRRMSQSKLQSGSRVSFDDISY